MEPVKIYTDGSSSGDKFMPAGGWAAWIIKPGKSGYMHSGIGSNMTSTEAELAAVAYALQHLEPPGQKVEVYTDSQYVIEGSKAEKLARYVKGIHPTGCYPIDPGTKYLWQKLRDGLKKHAVKFLKVSGKNPPEEHQKCHNEAKKRKNMVYGMRLNKVA